MATRSLQPSEYEIQREVEALRDIRRRSTTPGALTIDPDLPNQSPPASPTSSYWPGSTAPAGSFSPRSDSRASTSSRDSAFSSDHSSHESTSTSATSAEGPIDDPFHLFWVPASIHPEIAPAEFRAFLKEHARTPPPADGTSLQRSGSHSSSSGLGRKKSMLSRQYSPSENDGVEDEKVVPLRRNRSHYYTNRGPQLSINDLQRLEELAEETEDPSKLRNILRRSLSMNISPTAIDRLDEMTDMGDEADVPIIVPPPGQILRRAARTKIRKAGLPGDGNGHRFGASRRGGARTSANKNEPRTSSDMSSSDHGDDIIPLVPRYPLSDDGHAHHRPESFMEESSIIDSYARDESDDGLSTAMSPPEPPTIELPPSTSPPLSESAPPSLLEALGSILDQPQPQHLAPQASPDLSPDISRTPSPSPEVDITPEPQNIHPQPEEPQSTPRQPSPSHEQLQQSSQSHTPPAQPIFPAPSPTPLPQAAQQPRKDKPSKGLFKWGKSKGSEKEKDSGFFGSLFGNKKKEEKEGLGSGLGTSSSAGREAAQALLGASKSSKNYVPPTSPGLAPPVGANYARYPIHVERAIYRLSHIKLANPRRPLYEQVLISNLMFWYLGVINKAQNANSGQQNSQHQSQGVNGSNVNGAGTQTPVNAESNEKEQERAEKERQEKERAEREQRDREMEMKKKESGRRGSLTKNPAPGTPGGNRRAAEMPVRGPQYEMQHRVMEQEYGGYNGQGPHRAGATPSGGPPGPQYQRQSPQQQYSNGVPKVVQPQPIPPDQFYYSMNNQRPSQNHANQLPPGAMPPSDQTAWMNQTQHQYSRKQDTASPPPGAHRSKSPQNAGQSLNAVRYNNSSQESITLGNNGSGNRPPSRSLSANAAVPTQPPVNGHKPRKISANAAIPTHAKRPRTSDGPPEQIGEEEDVPLAVWQQQRRR
ncbi:hypothetical protein AX16_010419 [Volvariella volvacea WC 439]|nr:hypothetical protein AX16_010419 [Volvariella volvacea WC 439]